MKALQILLTTVVALAVTHVAEAQLFRRHRRGWYPQRVYYPSRSSQTSARTRRHQPTPQELKLVQRIKELQNQYVGISTGTEAYECFTWDDFYRFKRDRVVEHIAKDLRADKQFVQLVGQIRDMPSDARSRLLSRALRTYKPTWAQLGRISPQGQTDAGQLAEKMIAQCVVDLVKRLLQNPQRPAAAPSTN